VALSEKALDVCVWDGYLPAWGDLPGGKQGSESEGYILFSPCYALSLDCIGAKQYGIVSKQKANIV
jgi:hypothetical protein